MKVVLGLAVAVLVLAVLAVLAVLVGLAAVHIVPAVSEISSLVADLPARLSALGERFGGPGSTAGAALADPARHEQLQQALSAPPDGAATDGTSHDGTAPVSSAP
ncbi:hypothetical protein [Actinomycetospora lemnae]|uniref:Secreted protein n=1 Tax=Actinomycetospora lemnae TaxID=3019891 RepID=A0ABT5SUE1_9PSEU|nr:hypothetical protein [Actinomycetospora sp. DW7H6]MDD7965358.1 hypothetical protein [Actinomycetospora sp. DW7H6]